MGNSEKKDNRPAGTKKTTKKPAAKKTNWFKNLKGQFKTISWPTKETAGKQTGAVVIISVVLGLLITVIDIVFRFGLGFVVK